jgi:YaiO family outer membrane protein
MKGVSAWLFAVMFLAPLWPAAGQTRTQLQFGAAYEHLSNGYQPWRTATLQIRATGPDLAAHASVEETTRFSQLDHIVAVGVERRLTSRWAVGAEAHASPSHHFSATWGALGHIGFTAGRGWGVQTDVRHLEYTSAPVTVAAMTVERYVSRYRTAYSLYAARLHSDGSISHRTQGDVYYGGSSSSVGVSLSVGEEVESVVPGGVLRTQVRGAGVVGRHWFAPQWLVIYDALVQQQGALYTRKRISLGLARRF